MPPNIRLGTAYFRSDPRDYIEWLRVADDVGFDLIGYGDSQSLWPELYSSLTLAALHTDIDRIGSMVTNPMTRHPAVAASGIATVQALADGRAFFGLSSGDSALSNIGLRPARVDEVAEYGRTVKALCAGEKASYGDTELQLQWPTRPVPLYLAAEGPRMLRLAGQIADGVFVANGLTKEVIDDTVGLVRQGAEEAGRNPDSIEIWWLVKFLVADSVEQGIETLRFTLAGSANHVFRFTFDGKRVPNHLQEPIRELHRRYAFHEHAQVGPTHNADLVDELGLTDWLAERFAVTGPPAYCAERLQEIAEYGATNLVLTQLVPNPLETMKLWDAEVFSRLR